MPSYANVDAFFLSVTELETRDKFEELVAHHVEIFGVQFKNLLDLYARDSAAMWRQLSMVLGKKTTSSLFGEYRDCRECVVTTETSIHWLELFFALADRLTEDIYRQLGAM